MRCWQRNLRARCMLWRSRRRRPGKRDRGPLKRRPGPLRLFLLDIGLARDCHDPKCGDPVALAAQYTKTEAVEREALAALRDRARLVNHKARDRGRLFIPP